MKLYSGVFFIFSKYSLPFGVWAKILHNCITAFFAALMLGVFNLISKLKAEKRHAPRIMKVAFLSFWSNFIPSKYL